MDSTYGSSGLFGELDESSNGRISCTDKGHIENQGNSERPGQLMGGGTHDTGTSNDIGRGGVPESDGLLGRRALQERLELEWRKAGQDKWNRIGCACEASETSRWGYLEKTSFCHEFYSGTDFNNNRLADHAYIDWKTWWGVYKKCIDRKGLIY